LIWGIFFVNPKSYLSSIKKILMENESIGQRVARGAKKIVKRVLVAALVVGIIVFAFLYWGCMKRASWPAKCCG